MWEADLYREKHGFVFNYGKDLISMLNPQEGERILDLGCGTGELTAHQRREILLLELFFIAPTSNEQEYKNQPTK